MLTKEELDLQASISGNTVKVRVKGWVENFFANLPYSQTGLGVRILHEALKGVPAIVVGAGPSLDKNIAQLSEVQKGGKAAILCCDAALEAVLNAGCCPDIVLCAESKERVVRYLTPRTPDGDRFHDVSGMILVADTRISPKTREAWKGGIVWYNSMPIDNFPFSEVQHNWTGQIGALGSGGCVTSTLWCLAYVILRCSPILFVGQDCSFKDAGVHHAQTVNHAEQYATMSMSSHTDINGDVVFSTPPLLSFKLWFENIMRMNPGIFVNCTEGGLLSRCCLVMPLKSATDLFLSEPHDIPKRLEVAMNVGDEIMRVKRGDGFDYPLRLPRWLLAEADGGKAP